MEQPGPEYANTPSTSPVEATTREIDSRAQQDVNDRTQTREQREKWAERVFLISLGWLIAVLLLVTAQALSLINLANSVLIALVTTTTANILGTLAIVLRFIFPQKT